MATRKKTARKGRRIAERDLPLVLLALKRAYVSYRVDERNCARCTQPDSDVERQRERAAEMATAVEALWKKLGGWHYVSKTVLVRSTSLVDEFVIADDSDDE
jgi:hypothetical protein